MPASSHPESETQQEELPWIYNGFIGMFCFLVCSGILSSIFQRFRVSCINGMLQVERRAQVKTMQKRGSRSSLLGRFSMDKNSRATEIMLDPQLVAEDTGYESESEDCRRNKSSNIDPRLHMRAKARASANRKQSLRDSVRLSRSERRASRTAPRRVSSRLSVRQVNGPRWGDLRRGSQVPSMRISRSTRMNSERVSRSEKWASRSAARASRKMSYSYSEEFTKARSRKSMQGTSIGNFAAGRNNVDNSESLGSSSGMRLYE